MLGSCSIYSSPKCLLQSIFSWASTWSHLPPSNSSIVLSEASSCNSNCRAQTGIHRKTDCWRRHPWPKCPVYNFIQQLLWDLLTSSSQFKVPRHSNEPLQYDATLFCPQCSQILAPYNINLCYHGSHLLQVHAGSYGMQVTRIEPVHRSAP